MGKPKKYYKGAMFPLVFEGVVRKTGNLVYVSVPKILLGKKVEIRILEFDPEWEVHKGHIII